jgi:alkanesulfonate monooxygenase SsuD/methylene tetrahydromethanopterin reductase-like flavin-dependent oxidoreductase (luciferase family)
VALTDAFVDRFGIVGPSEHVAERFNELVELGLDHFIIVGHGRDVSPEAFRAASQRFTQEVLPRIRA